MSLATGLTSATLTLITILYWVKLDNTAQTIFDSYSSGLKTQRDALGATTLLQ